MYHSTQLFFWFSEMKITCLWWCIQEYCCDRHRNDNDSWNALGRWGGTLLQWPPDCSSHFAKKPGILHLSGHLALGLLCTQGCESMELTRVGGFTENANTVLQLVDNDTLRAIKFFGLCRINLSLPSLCLCPLHFWGIEFLMTEMVPRCHVFHRYSFRNVSIFLRKLE